MSFYYDTLSLPRGMILGETVFAGETDELTPAALNAIGWIPSEKNRKALAEHAKKQRNEAVPCVVGTSQ